ncbi:MAG: DUF2071 domain-containing protein [Deltaproteobacteria bacterium]|nr:DUF2071 domain-containing protein [Deltaproteobacteria bacterium]
MRFSGTERATVELDGYFHPRALVIPRTAELELDDDGRARVSLFAFHVDNLQIAGIPLIRASYAELLWRVAVRTGGRLGWWVVACDLSSRRARYLAEREIRYPVRRSEVTTSIDALRCVSDRGDLVISVGRLSEHASPERRGVFTGPRAEWEVPWSDDGSAGRIAPARVETDTLSAQTVGMSVTWAPVALVRTGRLHGCGTSRPR